MTTHAPRTTRVAGTLTGPVTLPGTDGAQRCPMVHNRGSTGVGPGRRGRTAVGDGTDR